MSWCQFSECFWLFIPVDGATNEIVSVTHGAGWGTWSDQFGLTYLLAQVTRAFSLDTFLIFKQGSAQTTEMFCGPGENALGFNQLYDPSTTKIV